MITDFIGKTLIEIVNNNEEVIFTFSDKTKYKMYHQQDCCETVYLEEEIGITFSIQKLLLLRKTQIVMKQRMKVQHGLSMK